MADHWVQFEQANHIPANTHPHPAPGLRPLHGQVRRVTFLTVLLAVVVYPYTYLCRTL